jgi:hypothetical protein
MPQRSPEWLAIRRGKITGSSVGKFVYNTDKKSLDARVNLIDTIIGEEADGDDCEPGYETYWMKRGTRLEPQALAAYEAYTGNEIEQVGFVSHNTLPLGVSPDALVSGRAFGLEMKCPGGKVAYKRIREKVCPEEYLPQIWLSMIVMDVPEWHFWSWHPKIPAFHTIVRRSDIPAGFEPGVIALCNELTRQKAEIEAMMAD